MHILNFKHFNSPANFRGNIHVLDIKHMHKCLQGQIPNYEQQ